ncbi:MAG: GNAT family N-acetyltransferase [Deltaproteobacteria bacterium]|nr:GNAT family N-acetyltransferase [Deltaproteobacteria bacterium]
MDISRLTEHDLPSLADLFRQFWGENSSLEKMQTTFARLATNSAYILLTAKQDELLVGFAMGIICEELYGDCKPFMVIEDLIVDKKQRRNGAGSALMQELEKCAMAHDCCQILFVTEEDRSEAHRFYRSLGYKFEPYKGFKKRIESGQQVISADS